MTNRGDERVGREERSRRAVEAAVSLARENRLRVEEPVVLNDLFSLMVHLRPAPVVARVATCMPKVRKPISAWLEREIAVTTFLSERGAPVVAPSRELPPGPHERDGFPISFWEYVEPDPNRTPTAADCSAMLVDLHEVLRSYPGELPMLGAGDIPRMMEELDPASDILSAADENLLRASAERLRPFWETLSGDIQPIHGDAHSGNLVAAREGGLVWIDFEDVCRGPVEWDLATMMDEEAVSRHHNPDFKLMAKCTELRTLQVALSLIAFHDDFRDINGWNEGLRSMLDILASHPGDTSRLTNGGK
jgi:Ser/Thr protein kinase RdoA (MazF antagonist)